MRLNRLDLIRYGKFTDRHVDFGACAPGKPDLHLVYGPNEAGKSTLFSAWLDLLYGMGSQTPYAFLHSYATLRIGADIGLAGGEQKFFRIKRPQNSLLDSHDRPLGDRLLIGELGGLERDAYGAMFSLDDRQLEQGGEDILRARGDLGQMLFSGSSGLADLGRRIAELRAEADGFFRPQARSGGLAELNREWTELKAARDAIDVQAGEFHARVAALDAATAQLDAAAARRASLRARSDQIARWLSARPLFGQWRALRAALDDSAALPEPPAHWAADVPTLRAEALKLDFEAAEIAAAREKAEKALAAATPDAMALTLLPEAQDWELARGRELTAAKDTPRLEEEWRALEIAVSGFLRALAREDEPEPSRLILPAATVAAFRDLLERRSGVETAVDKAHEALDALEQAAPFVEDAPEKNALAWGELAAALAAWRASDHEPRARQAEKQAQLAQRAEQDSRSALAPWRGDAAGLRALCPPGRDDLARWTARDAELAKTCAALEDSRARLTAESAHHAAICAALTGGGGLPSDSSAADLRAARDAAWRRHRAALNAQSALEFEQTLRADDEAIARRFAALTELTQWRDAARRHQVAEADLAVAQTRLEATRQARQALNQEIGGALADIFGSATPQWSLAQLADWMARRDETLKAAAVLESAEMALRDAQSDRLVLRTRLDAALLTLDLDATGDDRAVANAAEAALAAQTDQARRRAEWRSRRQALAKADAAQAAWREKWAQTAAACWLGVSGAPTPEAARGALDVNEKLAAALDAQKILRGRLDGMARDRAAFRALTLRNAARLGLPGQDDDQLDVADLDRRILARLRAAENDQQAAQRERVTLQRLDERDAARTRAQLIFLRRRNEMTGFFSVDDLDAVAARLDQIALRAQKRRECDDMAKALLDLLHAGALAEVESAMAGLDFDALRIEAQQVAAAAEEAEQAWRQALSAHGEAQRRRDDIASDAAAAEIEQRRRAAASAIEEGARRYLRQRAGEIAAEQALRLYRDQHRSAMMTSASQALATISRGAYVRLTTEPDRDSEILVAVGADGGAKEADRLSKGARFQLYLALRVAGFFEYARRKTPPPFIADDILESFDDFRAEETFRLFVEMAKLGQVVYLTHHRHLCDIARSVCPDVQIHQLAEPVDESLRDPDEFGRRQGDQSRRGEAPDQ